VVRRAHDAGILWIQQVFDLDPGAGGRWNTAPTSSSRRVARPAGTVAPSARWSWCRRWWTSSATSPSSRQGGIADGRGLAAALALGAQGVNWVRVSSPRPRCGSRSSGKEAIVAADALDAVKVDFAPFVLPPLSPGGVPAVPRVLRTSFVDRWNADVAGAEAAAGELRDQIRAAVGADRLEDLLPFAGQSAALIHDVATGRDRDHPHHDRSGGVAPARRRLLLNRFATRSERASISVGW
jgi:hypothetical protein